MNNSSPIGRTHDEDRLRRRADPEYARIEVELAPFEQLARLVIKHRMLHGLTQQQLAQRVGTSHSAISRIENGRHRSKPEILSRIAAALDLRFVMGFESGPPDAPVRELVHS